MIGRWLVFSVFLALMQLWTALAWIFGSAGYFPIAEALKGGVLIFWSTALSMKVAEDYSLFQKYLIGSSVTALPGDWRVRLFIRGTAVPFVVLWLAIVSYTLLLDSQVLTFRLFLYQAVLAVISFYHSLSHFLDGDEALSTNDARIHEEV